MDAHSVIYRAKIITFEQKTKFEVDFLHTDTTFYIYKVQNDADELRKRK